MHDLLFPVGKLLWLAVRPGNLFYLLTLALLIRCFFVARFKGRIMLAVAALAVAVPLLPTYALVLRPLEQRFPYPSALPDKVDGILVLGGAVDPLMTVDYGAPALTDAAERMTTFVALARQYPGARLVFSGGLKARRSGSLSESDAARLLFDQLGLSGRAITYEDASRNTFENAVNSYRLVAPKGGETWLLVTSAAHMPRAIGVFRQRGWPLIPIPVDYRAPKHADLVFDIAGNLQALDIAVHEWIGLLSYRLLGRSSDLLPAPEPRLRQ